MQKSTEHSETIKEQSNSVVSIEDAADAYAKGIANSDKTERRLAKCDFSHGANWQKEQYNSLLNSYRELLEMVKTVQPFFQEDAPIGTAIENALKQSNNILKQFNQ